jgi:hypothetical protein
MVPQLETGVRKGAHQVAEENGSGRYTPHWVRPGHWAQNGTLDLPTADAREVADWPAPVREALEVARRYGLPHGDTMCLPVPGSAPFSRVAGRFWSLGLTDTWPAPEYVLDETGRVWVLAEGVDPAKRFVNSSMIDFLDALAAWEYRCEHVDDFDDLEPPDDYEGDDDPAGEARVAFGMEIRDRLRELDPPAFEMDTWWDRVYEEVGHDAI